MDWTSIIQVLIGSGGIVGLFLITERKTAAALKNMQSMYDTLKRQYDDLLAQYARETDKVGKLYDQISALRECLDAANTRAAINELKRCDCINCTKRQPPMGDRWRMDVKQEEEGKEESNGTDA